jgi:hypothetical protein
MMAGGEIKGTRPTMMAGGEIKGTRPTMMAMKGYRRLLE